jgi:hypothetical protein
MINTLYAFPWHKCCIDTVRGSGAYGTDIEVDSNGYPHIIYKEIYDKGLIYVRWDGSGWLYEDISESLLVKEKGTSGMISLELDSMGYPHISTPGPTYIYKDGTGWHRETGMDPGSHDNDYTSLRLDSQGYPHIAYNDKYYIGPDEYTGVRYCWKDGGGWNVNVVVYPDPDKPDVGWYGVSLALDSLNLPHIMYSLGDSFPSDSVTMGYAYKDISSIWRKEYIETSWVSWGHYVNIELDSLDRPLVAYGFGSGTAKLRYANRESGIWNTEWIDTVGYCGHFNGFTLDSIDNPYIVYWSNNWLKIAWDSGEWNIETIDSVTSGDRLVTSYGIAIDKFGYIHISYSRSRGGMDQNRMWYATTHPTVGIGEELPSIGSMLETPSVVYSESVEVRWNVSGRVSISLYDITGRKVKNIYSGSGNRIKTGIKDIPAGIYFVILRSLNYREIKKVTIIK